MMELRAEKMRLKQEEEKRDGAAALAALAKQQLTVTKQKTAKKKKALTKAKLTAAAARGVTTPSFTDVFQLPLPGQVEETKEPTPAAGIDKQLTERSSARQSTQRGDDSDSDNSKDDFYNRGRHSFHDRFSSLSSSSELGSLDD